MRSNILEHVNWVDYLAAINDKIKFLKENIEKNQENAKSSHDPLIKEIVDLLSSFWSAYTKEKEIFKYNQKLERISSSLMEDQKKLFASESEETKNKINTAAIKLVLGDTPILDGSKFLKLDSTHLPKFNIPGMPKCLNRLAKFHIEYDKNNKQREIKLSELKKQCLTTKKSFEEVIQKEFKLNQELKNITAFLLAVKELVKKYQKIKELLSLQLTKKKPEESIDSQVKALTEEILSLQELFAAERDYLESINYTSHITCMPKMFIKAQKAALKANLPIPKPNIESKDEDLEPMDAIDYDDDTDDENNDHDNELFHQSLKLSIQANKKMVTQADKTVEMATKRLDRLKTAEKELAQLSIDLNRLKNIAEKEKSLIAQTSSQQIYQSNQVNVVKSSDVKDSKPIQQRKLS